MWGHDILRQDVSPHGVMRATEEPIQEDDTVATKDYTGHASDISSLVSQYSLFPAHHDKSTVPPLEFGVRLMTSSLSLVCVSWFTITIALTGIRFHHISSTTLDSVDHNILDWDE